MPSIPQVETANTTKSISLTFPSAETNVEAPCSLEEANLPLPPRVPPPKDVLDIDKETPDKHVPRDPRLIRLTGVHPFNVEAPLSALYDEGFITSANLTFVRNHGAVPEVRDEDIDRWELSIEGLVERPITLNLKQIRDEFEQITVPITVVCAGNRRKEQNVVQKTKGFSWGSAGVSTSIFTGPLMGEVLKRAKPTRRAKYVCMEGADQLPNGNYGTSLKLNWVMDPHKGIMLAHKINGQRMEPDHGHPLRAVVPGSIGGRSVKWLKKLRLTDKPSENFYHIYDNRVLPTQVTTMMATNEPNWWRDERYAIFDLSVNSAIAYPAHNELLSISQSKSSYKARGYAYGGGGRRVTRVEVSLDKGTTWRLADVDYPEDRFRTTNQILYEGRVDLSWRETCFCWCFWSLDIPTEDLEGSDALLLRAMDEAMNIQPRDMYWSVMGMMNNPWYRVAIVKEAGNLRFEHPVQPATIPGGWMERVKQAGGDLLNGYWGESVAGSSAEPKKEIAEIKMKRDDVKKIIKLEELKKNNTASQPWFVLKGEVYDGTMFLEGHPGGAQSIVSVAGTDATDEFMAIHSDAAKSMMLDYHIGTLDADSVEALKNVEEDEPSAERPTFLRPRSWTKAQLVQKSIVSWDTRILNFKLDHDSQSLGLPVGQHVLLRLEDRSSSETIIRAYTPISDPNVFGSVDVLIKVYFSSPTSLGGKMSMALDQLNIGATVSFKGPVGKFEYMGRGRVTVAGKERRVGQFVMICGGSGITPIYQVFRAVMQDPADSTRCTVLNSNRLREDILCKEKLDALASGPNGKQCKLIYTLTKAPKDWTGRTGRVDEAMIGEYVRLIPKVKGGKTCANGFVDHANGTDKTKCNGMGNGVTNFSNGTSKKANGTSSNGDTYTNGTHSPSVDSECDSHSDSDDYSDSDRSEHGDGETLVLVCGPEPMEHAVRNIFLKHGWSEDNLVMF